MNVADLMTRDVGTCHPGDVPSTAAQLMWDRDGGSVPVVGDDVTGEEIRETPAVVCEARTIGQRIASA